MILISSVQDWIGLSCLFFVVGWNANIKWVKLNEAESLSKAK